jgi:hypothetical protein
MWTGLNNYFVCVLVLCTQANMMFVMLLWVCIHTGQAEKLAWPRWESNPRTCCAAHIVHYCQQYCYTRFRLNNVIQYCWQMWTMWAAQHCSILLNSRLIIFTRVGGVRPLTGPFYRVAALSVPTWFSKESNAGLDRSMFVLIAFFLQYDNLQQESSQMFQLDMRFTEISGYF